MKTTTAKRGSILISGCSSGIGYCAAHILQQRGWNVYASARDAADVERLKSEGLNAVQLDLSSADSISMAVNWVLKNSDGKLNALFNNGAFAIPGAVEDLTRNALAYQLDNGLLGWHDLTRRILPIMRRQGGGRIVQNSSLLGLTAMRYRAAYVTMKFALEGLSAAMRLELKNSGISVSIIEPSAIESNFRDNAIDEFASWIDTEQSLHKIAYLNMINNFKNNKKPSAAPDLVVKALVHALEAPRPKAHYYVGKTTWMLAIMKRLLPTSLMDALILKIVERERRL